MILVGLSVIVVDLCATPAFLQQGQSLLLNKKRLPEEPFFHKMNLQ